MCALVSSLSLVLLLISQVLELRWLWEASMPSAGPYRTLCFLQGLPLPGSCEAPALQLAGCMTAERLQILSKSTPGGQPEVGSWGFGFRPSWRLQAPGSMAACRSFHGSYLALHVPVFLTQEQCLLIPTDTGRIPSPPAEEGRSKADMGGGQRLPLGHQQLQVLALWIREAGWRRLQAGAAQRSGRQPGLLSSCP